MSSLKICLLVLLALVFTAFGCSEALAGGCLIKVDFARAKIVVSEYGKKQKEVFPVGLPRYKFKNMPQRGRVVRIERNPSWVPTKNIKKYYREKYKIDLPDFIGPGEPANPMGAAKIIIEFEDRGMFKAVRIHGTNDLESIGRRQSLGCIRMINKDILALVKFISGKKTAVIFE
jgi:lipoprotein-anchoring transpeptidase ErfK/SrfK